MKFAVCNETFQEWPLTRGFEFAAACGYTGIEIAPFTICNYVTDITSAEREEVRREADKAGLSVVGLHWLLAKTEGFYLTSPDADVRGKTSDYFAALARCCSDMGGKIMVLGSPQQRNLLPGVSSERATAYAAEVIESFLPVLEETDITLALEPLAPTEGDFLQTAAEAVALAERIGSPNVRLHLDVKAMSSEAMPAAEVILQNGDLLAHFHANDPNLQGPGFGDEDFVPIFEALGQIDYQGWVSVEVFDYTPGVERLAQDSISYMNECLDKVRQ